MLVNTETLDSRTAHSGQPAGRNRPSSSSSYKSRRRGTLGTLASYETSLGSGSDSDEVIGLADLYDPREFSEGVIESSSPRASFLKECQERGIEVVEPLLLRRLEVRIHRVCGVGGDSSG